MKTITPETWSVIKFIVHLELARRREPEHILAARRANEQREQAALAKWTAPKKDHETDHA